MKSPDSGSEATSTFNLNNWMTDIHPEVKGLCLSQLSLPGAHNAGMDKEITQNDSYHACQDDPIYRLLENGIRVLDIRLMWYAGNAGGLGDKFIAYHGETGRNLGYVLNEVVRFIEAHPGEIVILDIHDMQSWGSAPVPYKEFHETLVSRYQKYMLPFSASYRTLGEIREQHPGPRMVVAVPARVCFTPNEPDRDSTYFWTQIEHRWIGKDLVSANDLSNYIAEVINDPPFAERLWSTSATAFSLAGGPLDIISYLKVWYPATGVWQSRSSIINFDWCTRSNADMVRQCIESNKIKTPRPLLKITSPVSGEVVGGQYVMVRGSGQPGAVVELYQSGVGNVPLGTGLVDASTHTWEVRGNISVGAFSVTCIQKYNGKQSRWAEDVPFTFIPAPIIITPKDGEVTQTVRPRMLGGGITVPKGVTVRLYVGNEIYGTATSDTYSWELVPTRDLPLGNISLTCDRVINGQASDRSQPVSITVTAKPRKPEVLRSEIGAGWVSVQLLSHADIANYTYALNGGPGTTTSSASYRFSGLKYGEIYTAEIKAANKQGVQSDVTVFPLNYVAEVPKPSGFHVTSNGGRSISMAWSAPEQSRLKLIGYAFGVASQPKHHVVEPRGTFNNLITFLPTAMEVEALYENSIRSEIVSLVVLPIP